MNTATAKKKIKLPSIGRVAPGEVILSEIGLIPTLEGLKPEFPNLSKSTVWRWGQSREAGGTGGIVPSRYHLPLLRLAQRLGRRLTTDDLIVGRSG